MVQYYVSYTYIFRDLGFIGDTFMSNTIFDLEQQILQCWNVIDDIKNAAEWIGDSPEFKDMPPEYSDKIFNLLWGIENVYQRRFDKCFKTFEDVAHEFHRRGKLAQVDREQELSEIFNKVMDEPIK